MIGWITPHMRADWLQIAFNSVLIGQLKPFLRSSSTRQLLILFFSTNQIQLIENNLFYHCIHLWYCFVEPKNVFFGILNYNTFFGFWITALFWDFEQQHFFLDSYHSTFFVFWTTTLTTGLRMHGASVHEVGSSNIRRQGVYFFWGGGWQKIWVFVWLGKEYDYMKSTQNREENEGEWEIFTVLGKKYSFDF